MSDKLPSKGDKVWATDGTVFTVSKRTRNAESGAVFLWDGERAYPLAAIRPYPPEPGTVVHRRSKTGWSGEVIAVEGGQVAVWLLPDKHWEKNPPSETWPLTDCRPSPVEKSLTERIAEVRATYEKKKAEVTHGRS